MADEPASLAESSAATVGDDELVGGSGDGDDPAMVRPVMIRTHEHEVVQLGEPAVFPVPIVVRVQSAGRAATGDDAPGVAVLQSAAQPAVDQPGRPPGTDHLAIAFEPHLAGGITSQVSPFGIGEQRAQM